MLEIKSTPSPEAVAEYLQLLAEKSPEIAYQIILSSLSNCHFAEIICRTLESKVLNFESIEEIQQQFDVNRIVTALNAVTLLETHLKEEKIYSIAS
jgi:hypothetical protein